MADCHHYARGHYSPPIFFFISTRLGSVEPRFMFKRSQNNDTDQIQHRKWRTHSLILTQSHGDAIATQHISNIQFKLVRKFIPAQKCANSLVIIFFFVAFSFL